MKPMLALLGALAALCLCACKPAYAQDGHAEHHATYQNWINGSTQGCCNDADCGQIDDKDVRTTPRGLEVFIRGVGDAAGQAEWCPVLARHYLTRGNAPDGSSHHACVTQFYGGRTPCGQFICYQPPAGG